MFSRLQPLTLVLVLIASIGVAAQERPDFSGQWVLVTTQPQADNDTAPALSIHQTIVRTTLRGEPMNPYVSDISIGRQFATGLRSETHHIGMLGGSVPEPAGDGNRNGPTLHHAVKWDGDALIFESGSHTGPRPMTGVWSERREAWSLDADARLRVTIATSSSSAASRTVTLLYRRQ
jgi:hypothetical protein